jgi:hypothetical protein
LRYSEATELKLPAQISSQVAQQFLDPASGPRAFRCAADFDVNGNDSYIQPSLITRPRLFVIFL